MATLWLKFPDELLATASFSAEEQKKFSSIFSPDENSPWRDALKRLGLKNPANPQPLIKWHKNAPYFNWAQFAQIISCGAMEPVKSSNGQYAFAARYSMVSFWNLVRAQWTITRYLQIPHEDSIAESLALGIAMQFLILRLGSKSKFLAQWLAAPPSAPPSFRKIVTEIQSIQLRRTKMSYVWLELFPGLQRKEDGEALPEFFWDDEIPRAVKAEVSEATGEWKAMPVCAGKITGIAVIMNSKPDAESLRNLKSQYNAPLILVFRNGHPKTVEYFPLANALVFLQGGILSHACTVAREMNIPAVTAPAESFGEFLNTKEDKIWLEIDGAVGRIKAL
jgi:phosphohistidine swiveling domain-containing protein